MIEEGDLSIPFADEDVYVVKYKKVHPQTLKFITKFGLDLRLFEREAQYEEYEHN